jgi:hypothetical protein
MYRKLLLTALILAGAAACEGDTSNDEAVGSKRIIVTTSGSSIDADGYSLTLSEVGTYPLAVADTIDFDPLPIGDYQATLGGVAANCTVQDGATRDFYLAMGVNAVLVYTVTCS